MNDLPSGLRDYVERRFGARLERAEALAADTDGGSTAKIEGYGQPIRLWLRERGGCIRQCVFRTARANAFGHERRSDRALQQLLAWDTFSQVPRQIPAVDIGAVCDDGTLSSLARAGELFLITDWADGSPYADDLRKLA